MAFQDLLKKQSSNLGKELNQLLERVLPLVDPDLVSDFVNEVDKKLAPQIQGKLTDLVKKSPKELQELFKGKDSVQLENLEKLADVFGALATKQNYEPAETYRDKALIIYQYITEKTATLSFARNAKVAALNN